MTPFQTPTNQERLMKLERALDEIAALVRAELQSNVGPPIATVVYDIEAVLEALEVKT